MLDLYKPDKKSRALGHASHHAGGQRQQSLLAILDMPQEGDPEPDRQRQAVDVEGNPVVGDDASLKAKVDASQNHSWGAFNFFCAQSGAEWHPQGCCLHAVASNVPPSL